MTPPHDEHDYNITASTNTILAIEVAKYKSVARVYDESVGEMSFMISETVAFDLTKDSICSAHYRRRFLREEPTVVTDRLLVCRKGR